MSLNATPSSERVQIAFFGRRNAGKSSLVNAVTGQELSLVSEVRGTTTDPVKKAMELLPLGPVVIIDTPGFDDEGELGGLRVQRAVKVLNQADLAVLVTDAPETSGGPDYPAADRELIRLFREKKIPYVIAWTKSDLRERSGEGPDGTEDLPGDSVIGVSAVTGENLEVLKGKLASLASGEGMPERRLVADLISPGDLVLLVIPIDGSAPKARLILPQQQVIRDILDTGGCFAGCRPEELPEMLGKLKDKPKLVITDSQAFEQVAQTLPREILLTSFSILFARYKGDLETLTGGAEALKNLKDTERVLIAEGCTHHRQCDDIGSVKLPAWIRELCGSNPQFAFSSGTGFPADLSVYRLIVHCGGCMLNEKEMRRRMELAKAAGVPMVNYGAAIACAKGVLERSLEPVLPVEYK
ncbi:MAG: [Firmicutes bacterium]|nr:[FeFe] hydrogenase H-cluster maturation GTPase HydF [Bacillota bacterium]